MKTLLTLAMIGLLLSCGNNTRRKTRADLFAEQYGANFEKKVGEVSLEVSDSENYSFDTGTGEYRKIENTKSSRKVTVLKVDGPQVYSLIETDFNGSQMREVELAEDSTMTELMGYLKNNKAYIQKNILYVTLEVARVKGSNFRDTGEAHPFETVETADRQYNVSAPCDFSETSISRELNDLRAPAKSTRKRTCQGVLSNDELKKIDLTKVRFCQISEGRICEEERDLSFITKDL